jgi:hypothetical protein
MIGSDLKRLIRTVNVWCDVYSIRHETMEERVRKTWWEKLKPYPFDEVQLALDRAHTHNRKGREPNRMFNLSQVETALAAIRREKDEAARADKARAAATAPQQRSLPTPTTKPLTEWQQKTVDAAPNAMRRLQRLWECEEQNRVLPMTTEEGLSRAKAYQEAMDQAGGIGQAMDADKNGGTNGRS